ncbi:MAG TPA: SUMF1/EgtB/PvdO family nonheme iron enzyme [Planctomycetota bacterium]|nr:SUMF1/EgtB/PvdO family nonheme iron enzyme [Planctomycetota bacterium]
MLSLLLLLAVQSVETVDVPGTKLKFDLVALPGGKATIGSPDAETGRREDEKRREVTLQPFRLGAREVTWKEFNAFRNSKNLDGVTRPTNADSFFIENIPDDFRTDPRPMTNARWHSAVMYCEWLSQKTGRYFRLPTETEWEYAARAGSDGAAPDPPDETAWHKGNSKGRTHNVGELKSNAFGLQDLIGNVWEYGLEPFAPPDYGPVVRGGCWSSVPRELRFANRQSIPLKWYDDDSNPPRSVWWLTAHTVSVGFRIACVTDASDLQDREAYAAKLEVKITGSEEKTLMTQNSPAPYRAVKGEIRNAGDRSLDEVELKVYYMEADGTTPHWIDQSSAKPGRATFSKTWPVLVNSAWGAAIAQPLKPGETRPFSVDLPLSFDVENVKDPKIDLRGQVTALRFSK